MLQWVLFMVVYKICCQNGRLPRTLALFMDSPVFTCPFMHQIKKTQKFHLYALETRALPPENKICYITHLLLLRYSVNTYCEKYLQLQQNTSHVLSQEKPKFCTEWWRVMLLMPLALHLIEFKNMDFCLGFFFDCSDPKRTAVMPATQVKI